MKKIIQYILLATTLIPFFTFSNIFFPSTFSKIFVFSALIAIASTVFLIEFFKNKAFKEDVLIKTRSLMKSKLFLIVSVFVVISLVSTIFAFNSYNAFWGNIERGEGFVMMVNLFVFLFLSLLLFEKKDWINYFKITVLVSSIAVLKSFWELLSSDITRVESFFGNPAFFSGYLLFSITSSLIVFKESIKNVWWKYFSLFVIIGSVVGIFISQTRSAILGLFVGFLTVLVYGLLRGKDQKIFTVSVKKTSIILLILFISFSGLFFLTRKSSFWSNIPGISRLSQIEQGDDTTSSRLLVWKMSLDSVNPKTQPKEFFLGWGMENSLYALGEFYNPEVYKYDPSFFDRSHNKFLDVLVMNGIFGLLMYVFIWFISFQSILKKKEFSFERLAILFFLSAFFTHIFFVFDQFPTSLTFFVILAFIITNDGRNLDYEKSQKNNSYFLQLIIICIFFFTCITFLRGNLVSYLQMRYYISSTLNFNENSLTKIEKVFNIDSPAQYNIRAHFLDFAVAKYGSYDSELNSEILSSKIMDIALEKGEEFVNKKERNFRLFNHLANAYNRVYEIHGDVEYLKDSEFYMRKALSFAPLRQELKNNLVFNLMHQNRFQEAISLADENIKADSFFEVPYYYKAVVLHFQGDKYYNDAFENFEKTFDLNNEYFLKNISTNTMIYGDLLNFFYKKRDENKFIVTANRLIVNGYPGSKPLKEVVGLVQKGIWPNISFE